MRRLLKIINRLRAVHPPMEDLVEWADGAAQPALGHHLEACTTCRSQALHIRRASQTLEAAADLPALAVTLERLQTRMQAWHTVELYFGRKAAGRMAANSAGNLHVIQPMFRAFLGAAAADALAKQIAAVEC